MAPWRVAKPRSLQQLPRFLSFDPGSGEEREGPAHLESSEALAARHGNEAVVTSDLAPSGRVHGVHHEMLDATEASALTDVYPVFITLGAALFLGEALTRLDGCGADTELIALARSCLAAEARQAVQPREPHGRLRIASMESTAASRLPALDLAAK